MPRQPRARRPCCSACRCRRRTGASAAGGRSTGTVLADARVDAPVGDRRPGSSRRRSSARWLWSPSHWLETTVAGSPAARPAGSRCGRMPSMSRRRDANAARDRCGKSAPGKSSSPVAAIEQPAASGSSPTATSNDVHRRLADEARDEQVGRPLLQLRRRRVLLQHALLHDGDPVGEGDRLGLVVGDEHRRHAVLDQIVLDPGAQDRAQLRLELATSARRAAIESARRTRARARLVRCCWPAEIVGG